jgi:hypothetical protein
MTELAPVRFSTTACGFPGMYLGKCRGDETHHRILAVARTGANDNSSCFTVVKRLLRNEIARTRNYESKYRRNVHRNRNRKPIASQKVMITVNL